jgi:hypothetical protein
MSYKLFFDGACEPNPGEMGIGVVVFNDKNEKVLELSEKCGFGTNIKAEYSAIIRGFEELSKLYQGHLLVHGIKRERNKEADMLSARSLGLDLTERDESRVQLVPGHSYEFVFDDDLKITKAKDEKYNREIVRYKVLRASKDGIKIRGTYFETGAKKLIESLKLRKPLLNKKIRIIPTKQQNWIEYIIEEL